MKTGSTHENWVTRPNTVYHGDSNVSQEQEGPEDLKEHRERIRKIIDEDRDILDELA